MFLFLFKKDCRFPYHLCGKFQAPSNEWMHLTRVLTDFELIIVTEGILYIADERMEYQVKAGECLLMAPTSCQHGCQSGSCSFYWLHFGWESGKEVPYSLLEYKKSRDLSLPDENCFLIPLLEPLAAPERVIILMKQLQDSSLRYHNTSLNDSLTAAILSEISCQNRIYKNWLASRRTSQVLHDIMDYIQYHSSETIHVQDLASYFGYSEKYLSTFFKKQAGLSLKQFILQVKMEHAMAELTDTNHTVSQVAFNVGFRDAHNFSNAFKKITGLSPSKYRESYSRRILSYH